MGESKQNNNCNGDKIRMKTLWSGAGVFIAFLTLVSVIHAMLVVPAIMNQVNTMVEEEVKDHRLRGPHPGAVMRQEFDVFSREVLNRLDRIERKIDEK